MNSSHISAVQKSYPTACAPFSGTKPSVSWLIVAPHNASATTNSTTASVLGFLRGFHIKTRQQSRRAHRNSARTLGSERIVVALLDAGRQDGCAREQHILCSAGTKQWSHGHAIPCTYSSPAPAHKFSHQLRRIRAIRNRLRNTGGQKIQRRH